MIQVYRYLLYGLIIFFVLALLASLLHAILYP